MKIIIGPKELLKVLKELSSELSGRIRTSLAAIFEVENDGLEKAIYNSLRIGLANYIYGHGEKDLRIACYLRRVDDVGFELNIRLEGGNEALAEVKAGRVLLRKEVLEAALLIASTKGDDVPLHKWDIVVNFVDRYAIMLGGRRGNKWERLAKLLELYGYEEVSVKAILSLSKRIAKLLLEGKNISGPKVRLNRKEGGRAREAKWIRKRESEVLENARGGSIIEVNPELKEIAKRSHMSRKASFSDAF